jgi:uncharacterized protein YbjQ (UPF0145 family)
MTDIVEQLRDLLGAALPPYRRTVITEAADAIEALQSRVKELEGVVRVSVEAYQTGQYEPQRIAHEAAMNCLDDGLPTADDVRGILTEGGE